MQIYITHERPTLKGNVTERAYVNLNWTMDPTRDSLSLEAGQAIADIILSQPGVIGVEVHPNK